MIFLFACLEFMNSIHSCDIFLILIAWIEEKKKKKKWGDVNPGVLRILYKSWQHA